RMRGTSPTRRSSELRHQRCGIAVVATALAGSILSGPAAADPAGPAGAPGITAVSVTDDVVTVSGGAAPGADVDIYALGTEQHVAQWAERSEEHTSELQSRENLVCRLLL